MEKPEAYLRALAAPLAEAQEGSPLAVARFSLDAVANVFVILGLLPAALSHAIGSDSQRPFAIVIVGGLIAALVMSIFLLPTLYVWIAGDHDVLPAADGEFTEGEHVD